jgi:hypothetical protein
MQAAKERSRSASFAGRSRATTSCTEEVESVVKPKDKQLHAAVSCMFFATTSKESRVSVNCWSRQAQAKQPPKVELCKPLGTARSSALMHAQLKVKLCRPLCIARSG